MLAMEIDTSEFERKLKILAGMPDLIRKTVTATLSETVDDLYVRQQMEMKNVFNNPTPYVLKGLKKRYPGGKMGQGVTKAGTYFEYFPIAKSPEDIVKPHVFGGKRSVKRSERRLSGIGYASSQYTVMGDNYPRNGSGDISGARYSQMLHQIGVMSEMAQKQLPGNKRKAKAGISYFRIVQKGGSKNDPAIAIAERRGSQMTIMLVFARSVSYPKRYDYFGVGEKQVAYSLPTHFNRIINRYLSRIA